MKKFKIILSLIKLIKIFLLFLRKLPIKITKLGRAVAAQLALEFFNELGL